MASVFRQKGRPYWFMQITLPDGTRPAYRSTRTKSKREAEAMASEWETRGRREHAAGCAKSGKAFTAIIMEAERLANEGALSASKTEELVRKIHAAANPEAHTVTLESHWEAVIRRRSATLAESSLRNHKYALKRWKQGLGPIAVRPLAKLTLDDLEAALPKVAKGLSPGTAKLYRDMLISVLKDAAGRQLIDSSPAASLPTVSRLKGLEEQAVRGPFSPDEIAALLAVADDEWRGMILGGFYTSLRMMDLARLTAEDIEDGFITTTSAKTGTTTDTPVHPRLAAWIGERTGPLFPRQRESTNAAVSTRFSALMRKADVPKERTIRKRRFKRSFHSLRHSFATYTAAASVPQDVRMALTGSSDAKVASRYVHVSDESLMEAIAALPNLELDEGVA